MISLGLRHNGVGRYPNVVLDNMPIGKTCFSTIQKLHLTWPDDTGMFGGATMEEVLTRQC